MLFGKRKGKVPPLLHIPAQVVAIWGPAGNNTAPFSWELAQELAKYARVMLVELPCLGIPRLSFAANILDRNKHVEAALTEYWYKGQLAADYLDEIEQNLALLPICAFANPDSPLTARVALDVLREFPVALINSGRQKGYEVIIFVCQGQLTNPLTFFALKYAQRVIMPVNDPSAIAYTSLNIKKLVHTFQFPLRKFTVVTPQYSEIISEVMWLKDEKQGTLPITVVTEKIGEIVHSFMTKTCEAM